MLRQSKRALGGAAAAFILAFSPIASVQAATGGLVQEEYSVLKPGDFRWWPDVAQSGPVEIVVSLPMQVAYVYRGGALIGVSTVSTGKPGHETPYGSFEILQKRRDHRSNKYNDAPMPFMQRLTWGGVALHAGKVAAGPASHGCIRLPLAFARHLYGATELGGWVHVIERNATPEQAVAYLRGGAPAVQLAAADD